MQTPCFEPSTLVAEGNDIAGVPESNLYAQLRFGASAGWYATLEGRYLSSVAVDDLNSASAPSYEILGLGVGYVHVQDTGELRGFVRVENLFDEQYVGSVIVNERNGRYYEPGPDRALLVGVQFDWTI